MRQPNVPLPNITYPSLENVSVSMMRILDAYAHLDNSSLVTLARIMNPRVGNNSARDERLLRAHVRLPAGGKTETERVKSEEQKESTQKNTGGAPR